MLIILFIKLFICNKYQNFTMPLSSLTTRNTCKNNNSVYLLFNLKIIMLPGSESVLNKKYNGIKYCKYNAVKYCQNGKKKKKTT